MDKRKVIAAYRQGYLTMQECAQIIGIDAWKLMDIVDVPKPPERLLQPRNIKQLIR